ncbi:MAG: methyltransferase family protein [Candidatus Kapaibacterium sp.]
MNSLKRKAFEGLVFLFAVLCLVLFLPAWTIFYPQAWAYLFVFFVSVTAITLYLMKRDTALLERRMTAGPGAEKEKSQKVIQFFAQFAFISIYVLSALDHRFGWSAVPVSIIVIGDILVALGLFIVFLVFKENTFTSGIIEVGKEQTVISTGPYAIVRHPMYIGALLMLLGTPIALDSWWGLLTMIPFTFVIIVRLRNEEKFLLKNLPGYTEYFGKVRYRLVPGIY